jgi:hypothetical protein
MNYYTWGPKEAYNHRLKEDQAVADNTAVVGQNTAEGLGDSDTGAQSNHTLSLETSLTWEIQGKMTKERQIAGAISPRMRMGKGPPSQPCSGLSTNPHLSR